MHTYLTATNPRRFYFVALLVLLAGLIGAPLSVLISFVIPYAFILMFGFAWLILIGAVWLVILGAIRLAIPKPTPIRSEMLLIGANVLTLTLYCAASLIWADRAGNGLPVTLVLCSLIIVSMLFLLRSKHGE